MKLFLSVLLFILLSSCFGNNPNIESTCYGTTKKGAMDNGARLPESGPNFLSYSTIGIMLRRTYVHSKVKEILLDSFKILETSSKGKVFVYGETGFPSGGSFKPHKTHQNGLSVDIMVPIIDIKTGKSIPLPTSVFNKWGYSINFNELGVNETYKIDFEALSELMVQIYKSSKNKGVKIWRIIFDPRLQPLLYATKNGEFIKKNIMIPTRKSWVRHDEHFHVDFDIPCKALK